jgi:hypothetical protein
VTTSHSVPNNSVPELLEKVVEALVAGETDKASARCDFLVSLRKIGLWYLSSDEDWLNTIVDLNTEIRQGWRQYDDGIREGILDAFPAQELFALSKRKPEPYDWQERWVSFGGAIIGGRMVAPKDSEIWCRISDFGLPFPAYARRSGMWVRDVSRTDAMRLVLSTAIVAFACSAFHVRSSFYSIRSLNPRKSFNHRCNLGA